MPPVIIPTEQLLWIVKENPNYYSVIPASVRYDKRLNPNTKLLYSEITALSNKSGKCWASNNYFASLYGVDRRTIIRWVKELKECGYINIEHVYEIGKKEIKERIITLTEVVTIPSRGGDKNVTTWGQKCREVVTNLSRGSDIDVVDNIKHNTKEEILNMNTANSELFENNKELEEVEENPNNESDMLNANELQSQISDESIIKLITLSPSKQEKFFEDLNLDYMDEIQLKKYIKERSIKINPMRIEEPKTVQSSSNDFFSSEDSAHFDVHEMFNMHDAL